MPPALCFATTPFAGYSKFSTMSSDQQYCLRWNNHSHNFITVFDQLLKTQSFTDVTLAAEGVQIKCHKMVLAACSSYFQDLFLRNPCEHPVILLGSVKHTEIKAILDYMYKGEVNVHSEDLPGLLQAAASLKIKGLVEDPENKKPKVEPSNGMLSPSAMNHSVHSTTNGQPQTNGDTSPLSRKKMTAFAHTNGDTPILRNVLGQGHYMDGPAVEKQEASFSTNSNGSFYESDRRSSAELSESMLEEEEMYPKADLGLHRDTRVNGDAHFNGTSSSKNKSSTGKPEWKRYKQYTREDIQKAMEAVKNKEMSALQAARKFHVPSRTLYDKLKKAGILPSRGVGITRQREPASVIDHSSARFPYSSSVNGSVYGSSALSESEAEPNGLHNGALVMDMSRRSTSPPVRPQLFVAPIVMQQDDQVEDLSIAKSNSRKSDNTTPVIVPSPAAIKQEQQDSDMV